MDCGIGRVTRQASDGTRRIPFAIGDELSAISLRRRFSIQRGNFAAQQL